MSDKRLRYPIKKLPILPDAWSERDDVVFLMGSSYYIETSKTCTEEYGIAFLIADGHHVAYRYLKGTSFGYGG
jgi:hypothetical protein